MIQDFIALASVAEGRDPTARRKWLSYLFLSTAAEVLMLYSQMEALTKLRTGEGYFREFAMYSLGTVLWFFATNRLYDWANRAYPEGARQVSHDIVGRVCRLPLTKFEAIGRGNLVTRLINDTNRVAHAARSAVEAPRAIVRMFLGVIFALSVSTVAALVAGLSMAAMGAVVAMQVRTMSRGFGQIADGEVRLYELLRGHVRGIKLLKLHHPRKLSIKAAFHDISERLHFLRVAVFREFFDRQHTANTILYGVLGFNVFCLPLIASIDAEVIRDINLVLLWVVASVISIVINLPEVSRAADALKRLRTLSEDLTDDLLEPPVTIEIVESKRFDNFEKLTLHGLEFYYPSRDGRPGFKVGPISLEFERGQTVFITGHNGSGKSTFLKMLTALYRPTAGDKRVDGVSIGRAELVHYRELFSTIFTDHHLFERAFGVTPDQEEHATELLTRMAIAHKTSVKDGRVTNRELSTGQKKRLAMVLARLSDRPILLFDEWAADQDPDYRKFYYHQILPRLRSEGKLVLAVTHDDQYFHLADRIIHFNNGQCAEERPEKRTEAPS